MGSVGWLDGSGEVEGVFPCLEVWGGWFGLEGVAVGAVPGDVSVRLAVDGPSVFVDEAVMEST